MIEYLLISIGSTAIFVAGIIFAFRFNRPLRARMGTAWSRFQTNRLGSRSLQEVQWINKRSHDILEAAGDGIFGVDHKGNVVFANDTALDVLGYSRQELLKMHCNDFVQSPDIGCTDRCSCSECPLCASYRDGTSHRSDEDTFLCKDGNAFPVEYTSEPIREGDELIGAVVSFRDITNRRIAQSRLRLSDQVIDSMSEAVMITHTDGTIETVNPAFEKNTGYSVQEITGQKPGLLRSDYHNNQFYVDMWRSLIDTGTWQGEIWNRRKSGEIYPEWLNISAIRDSDGNTTHYVGIFSDINTQEQVKQRLHHLAYYDALTELPNRYLLNDHLELALVQHQREKKKIGVLFLDLDRFKLINDTLGHSVGDQLLKEVSKRLKESVRKGDTIARIGGDEFTVILPGLDVSRYAANVASKIISNLSEPIRVQNKLLHITASIGISIYPNDGEDVETLLKNADTAMYRAKDIGRGEYQFYEQYMSESFHHRLQLENDLREAIRSQELTVMYQPQITLKDKQITGFEALARWTHPQLGEISPSVFIPIAEEIGQMAELGELITRQALQQLKDWQDYTGLYITMAINVSNQQLRRKDFFDWLIDVVNEYGLLTSDLELELTESVLIESHGHTTTNINRLHEMGVQFTIDDFGTGYSSMSYLKRFPISHLKIDRSFIQGIPENEGDAAMVGAIIAMANSLNLKVTTEGVETQQQFDFLNNYPGLQMQGYFYSPAQPAEKILELLQKLQRRKLISPASDTKRSTQASK